MGRVVALLAAGSCLAAGAADKVSLKQQAWELLRTGVIDDNTDHRAAAVGVLSLLPSEPEARRMARKALLDEKPEVRAAAASSLGELRDARSIPKLREALDDKDLPVVLAASHALIAMKDQRGYEVYYAILSGQRKGNHGLLAGQMETLKDPKKMAELGFRQGMGFVPFGSLGYRAIMMLMKDDAFPVRAAAARVLAEDPDPESDDVLVEAATADKNVVVRMAALEAIARRNRPALIQKIAPAMEDNDDSVKYTAAAAVLRLSRTKMRKTAAKTQ